MSGRSALTWITRELILCRSCLNGSGRGSHPRPTPWQSDTQPTEPSVVGSAAYPGNVTWPLFVTKLQVRVSFTRNCPQVGGNDALPLWTGRSGQPVLTNGELPKFETGQTKPISFPLRIQLSTNQFKTPC